MAHLEGLAVEAFCDLCHLSFGVDEEMMAAQGQGQRDVVQMARKIADEQRNAYLDRALLVCEDWGMSKMHVAVSFFLEYGLPMSHGEALLVEPSKSSHDATPKLSAHLRGLSTDAAVSPTGLHREVMASVRDVDELLEESEEDEGAAVVYRSNSAPLIDDEPRRSSSRGKTPPSSTPGAAAKRQQGVSAPKSYPRKTSKVKSSGYGQKKPHPRPGGIYKLLLEEQGDGGGEGAHETGGWGASTPVEISTDSTGGAPASRAQRRSSGPKGGAMQIEEFVRSEHSLQPQTNSKKSDSQKRYLCTSFSLIAV